MYSVHWSDVCICKGRYRKHGIFKHLICIHVNECSRFVICYVRLLEDNFLVVKCPSSALSLNWSMLVVLMPVSHYRILLVGFLIIFTIYFKSLRVRIMMTNIDKI